MEERSEGILLRPTGPFVEKLSWEDTAREMAAAHEDWKAWDVAIADGLADLPWRKGKQAKVAERSAPYRTKRPTGKRG